MSFWLGLGIGPGRNGRPRILTIPDDEVNAINNEDCTPSMYRFQQLVTSGSAKKMKFYVKQRDDGEVDISTPYELDEVELALRLSERKQARKRIVDLAETLASSESE